MPVVDKDEHRLRDVICENTVPSLKEEPATSTMTCEKKVWSEASTWRISTILHPVAPVLKGRQHEVEQGPTFSKSTNCRCSFDFSRLCQVAMRERKQNNTCLDEKDERRNFVVVGLQSFTSFFGGDVVGVLGPTNGDKDTLQFQKPNVVRLGNTSSQGL